jgi:hypothetical protein
MIGEAYNAGQSVTALIHLHGVQRGTILDHLARYALDGNPLRRGDDLPAMLELPAGQREAALQAFEELGAAFLKPVFDRLEGAVAYDDLKVLRLYFLRGRK